jgi:hypothetical protein
MGRRWQLELTTADPEVQPGSATFEPRELVDVIAHSITILKRAE